jgi:uncharacterized membrane-anchored protein
VVNTAASISGRYPNLGPLILVQAGVTLVDRVGPLLLDKVSEGDRLRVEGDRIYSGQNLVGVGVSQTEQSVVRDMEDARERLGEQLESFARNTVDFIQRERDLLFGGAGVPELDHRLDGRAVLVVVRGYNYREDLGALRPYIRDVDPVLVGVDGGADALIDAGYVPDLIVGDMDSVSERALRLAIRGGSGRRLLRGVRAGPELVLHAYPGGRAPGRGRLDALGVPYRTIEGSGTSEDMAFLLAHEKRADLIVAVGTHGNLREFLDKGRSGMASTFLVRLRVGEILMDAKGVSRVYGAGRIRPSYLLLLVGSALFAMLAMTFVSHPLRLFFQQLIDQLRGLLP